MSKFERRVWFERLVELRETYRQAAHAPLEMTIADAVAYADRLLMDPLALDAALADEPIATTNPPSA